VSAVPAVSALCTVPAMPSMRRASGDRAGEHWAVLRANRTE